MIKDSEITVLDSEYQFLEYTHPAIARKLIKSGQAIIYSQDPFIIQIQDQHLIAEVRIRFKTLRSLVNW